MKKIFNLTNKYIVLATPLILFVLVSNIYLAVSATGKLINLVFAILLFMLMMAAFIAGWFNMIKLTILYPERENPNSLIKEFSSGVGEYFASSLGLMFVTALFFIIISYLTYLAGMHFIGDPGISAENFVKAFENTTALKSFLSSLTTEQLNQINLWNLLLLGSMAVSYFLLLLYVPAMFFKTKNPFKAFWLSLKDLFSKKFFKTFGVYLLIFISNFCISILAALFSSNIITNFIMTLINFYYLTFVGIGIFYYYHTNFVLPSLGQNIDTRV